MEISWQLGYSIECCFDLDVVVLVCEYVLFRG